jgi:ribonucleoside-diphosphate reductase beta chain
MEILTNTENYLVKKVFDLSDALDANTISNTISNKNNQKSCIVMNDDIYYTEFSGNQNIISEAPDNNDYFPNKQIEYEPFLDESNRRFTLFPIKYPDIWSEYKKQEKSFWTTEEIDFSQDYKHFEKLDENKQHVIKMILAFFASMDGIVNFNIDENLLKKITVNEVITTYRFQATMEGIHNECYSLMIDNLIKNPQEKLHLFNSIKTIPSIKKIADWAIKWIESDTSIAHKLIAFACVEGILFSGAFAIIYWFKKYEGGGDAFMPGLIKSNELISRDEGFHCDFACDFYYKYIMNKISEKEAHQIIKESVEIAKYFNENTIKYKLIGINSDKLNKYTEYIADRLAVSLGYSKIYKIPTCPAEWMGSIGMVQKTNFHESRPTEYKSAHLEFTTESTFKILDNEDF